MNDFTKIRFVGNHPDRVERLKYLDLFGNKFTHLEKKYLVLAINKILQQKIMEGKIK